MESHVIGLVSLSILKFCVRYNRLISIFLLESFLRSLRLLFERAFFFVASWSVSDAVSLHYAVKSISLREKSFYGLFISLHVAPVLLSI